MTYPQSEKQNSFLLAGLGWWNIYFIIKMALYSKDIIDFHPLENFAFVIFLLFPIRNQVLKVTRQLIAFPIAFWLAHFDSFLPPLSRLWAQMGQLLSFKFDYLLELAGRFVSYDMLLLLVVLIFSYYFLNRYFRVSVFVIAAMIYISLPEPAPTPAVTTPVVSVQNSPTQQTATTPAAPASNQPITDQLLNQVRDDFFADQATKTASFPTTEPSAPFDVLFLSICSVAWDDIEMAGLEDHPLLKQFDIMFDSFSAATSYSGPAVVRLLRAGCGQEPHEELFEPTDNAQCYLFDNLAKLGFKQDFIMNHDGQFDDFTGLLKKDGHLKAELQPHDNLPPYQVVFDGSEIYRDADVLNQWWQQRLQSDDEHVVTLFNTISLHDGNRLITKSGETGIASYRHRLKNLFDDLNNFIESLKQSKRNIVVVLVPEHGAGMRGDKMQIQGMRELPAPSIVHTPVGLKVIGGDISRDGEQVHVKQPSSYLALSTLIGRILDQDLYSKPTFSAKDLSNNLPETPLVAQNSGSTVMDYQGKSYISLDGKTWTEYPTK